MNNRYKNYGLWISVAALIPILLSSFGIQIIPNYELLVNSILGILVLAGILNDPTSENKGYLDDTSKESDENNNR